MHVDIAAPAAAAVVDFIAGGSAGWRRWRGRDRRRLDPAARPVPRSLHVLGGQPRVGVGEIITGESIAVRGDGECPGTAVAAVLVPIVCEDAAVDGSLDMAAEVLPDIEERPRDVRAGLGEVHLDVGSLV